MNIKQLSITMAATLAAALSLITMVSCSSQLPSQVNIDPFEDQALVELVNEVYNSMTIEQRAAQLHGVRSKLITVDGKLDLDLCRKMIPHGVGQISQYACTQELTPEQLRDFVRDLQAYVMSCTDAKVPAIFHEELITGVATKGATTYPQQIGVSCSWNTELVELKSKYSAESLRAIGGQFALSPMVDVVRSQFFNRGEEGYGEDSYLGSAMTNAFVVGLHGDDLKRGVETTTKHFLGYGGGINLPEKELMEEILMPHEVAIRMASSKGLMPGYHSFKGESAITNHYFLQDILRNYMKFDGLIVSDYGAIASMKKAAANSEYAVERAVKAANAGADIELCDPISFPMLPELVKQGKVSEARFEEMVKRNLMLKARLGLLDESPVLYGRGELDLNKPEYVDLAYTLATQSVVLLKNNGVLPLSNGVKNIALVGPNADSPWALYGDYTYPAHHTFFQGKVPDLNYIKGHTLHDGLKAAATEGVNINFERGCDWDSTIKLKVEKGGDARIELSKMDALIKMLRETAPDTNWERAMAQSKSADVVIAAMGENLSLCGEGRNRKGIRLPGEQEKFVEELIDGGKPVVLVVFGGRAQLLSKKILNGAAAIIQAWYPGQEGGRAIADIMVGKVNPSGKLSASYPATDKRMPLCYNYGDAMKEFVEFPFGYGLSYTTFDYSDISSTPSVKIGSETIEVSATITNSGKCAGAEVVQLYLSPAEASDKYKPIQLRGFERVELAAGESKRVTFALDPRMLAYFDIESEGRAQGKWVTEPMKFVVKVGASSADIRLTAPLELTGKSHSTPLKDYYMSTSSVK